MGSDVVAVDAQYLGILLLEPVVGLPEGDGLAGSTRGEVKHVEGQDHVLLAPVLAEGNVPFTYRWQAKIGGDIANFCGHLLTFPCVSLASVQRHGRDYTLQAASERPPKPSVE
jgi:hypothetical protein